MAERAGISQSNLSAWLRGKPMIGEDKLEALLDILGLRGGVPQPGIFHEWKTTYGFTDATGALKIYFPGGAKFMLSPWSVPGFRRLKSIVSPVPDIIALSDGRVSGVIRASSGSWASVVGAAQALLQPVRGNVTGSLLDISETDRNWTEGPLNPKEFAQCFAHFRQPVQEDLSTLLIERGISIEEAINVIRDYASLKDLRELIVKHRIPIEDCVKALRHHMATQRKHGRYRQTAKTRPRKH